MVAIVTGTGLGLLRDSGSVLGGRGQLGVAGFGQAGGQVTVNASNGNLVIQSVDEMLIGTGLDDIIANTYNSQGTFTANGWQESFQRHTGGRTGTVNVSGTITHYAADGSAVVYTYNSSKGLYVGNEQGGAYDTLSFNASNNQWTWQDGRTLVKEVYGDTNNGRLTSSTDADGNTLTYTYDSSSGKLTKITTAGGDYTTFTYDASSRLTAIGVTSGGTTFTRISYTYDSSNRLLTTTVDLTPADGTDSKVCTSTYGYDGTSDRVASITVSQNDGGGTASYTTGTLGITYVLSGSVYEVQTLTETTANGSAVTTFNYAAGQTTVTDPLGNVTTMVYDTNGQLTRLISPPATAGATPQTTIFTYDSNGNLLSSGPKWDPNFTNIAANWGDLNYAYNNVADPAVVVQQSTGLAGNVPIYTRTTQTTPTAGSSMRLGQGATAAYTSVVPGQTVQFSVYVASTNTSTVRLYAMWRTASGSLVTSTAIQTFVPGGGTLGANGVANALFASGSAVAPAGAVYVEFMVQGVANGNGPMSVSIAQPSIDYAAPSFLYTYDANGNRLTQTDALGNKTVNVYDGNNQLLTQTIYPTSGTPLTTRYAYDAESHLVYTISPLGEVTKYIYNTAGQQTSIIQFVAAGDVYDVSTLATTASVPAATMDTWATATGRSFTTTQRTDMTYDPRGALLTSTVYKQTNSDGTGVTSTLSTTNYAIGTTGYSSDTAGRVLNRAITATTRAEAYVYDGLGRVTSVTDFNGNATLTVYGKSATTTGAATTITMANGETQVSAYDLAGNLMTVTVSNTTSTPTIAAATTNYTYDLDGNLVQVMDPTGVSTYFVYDGQGRKVADVTDDGAITAYAYNGADQVISTVAYANKLTSAQLTLLSGAHGATTVSLANVTPGATANDRWNFNVYDDADRLVETIDAQGAVTTFAYDGASQLVATTAYANRLTAATLSGFQAVEPAGMVLPAADASNDRTARIFYDADGYLTTTVYDGAGEKIHTIAYATAAGSSLWAAGTLQQLVTSVGTSAGDIHNWFVYSQRGSLTGTIDGEGNVTTYGSYTAAGFVGKITKGLYVDPAVLIASSTPPNAATLSGATGSNLEITSYSYLEPYGHIKTKIVTLADGSTESTSYTYDALYNLTSQSTVSYTSATVVGGADGRNAVIVYDGLGRKVGSLSGLGAAGLPTNPTPAQINTLWAANKALYGTTYAYDAANRLISQTDPDGNRTLFYYDADGRLAYQVDGAGDVVQYGYDTFSEQSDVTRYAGTISASTLATLMTAGGGTITSTLTTAVSGLVNAAQDSHTHVDYNVTGTVNKTTDAMAGVTAYTYDAFGEVTIRVDPLTSSLTTTTAKTYSRRGLLKTSTADVGGLALQTAYTTYDAFGHATQVTDPNGIISTMAYDRNGRMTKAIVDFGTGTHLNLTTAYSYDHFGHVLTATDPNGKVTTYGYNAFDRTVTVTDPNGITTTTTTNAYGQTVMIVDGAGATTTYDYDADGNLTRTVDGAGNITTRAYDGADLMTSVTDACGTVTSYTYDAARRLHTQIVDPGILPHLNLTTTWHYDGKSQTLTVTDPANTVTTYTYDLDGRKLTAVVDDGTLSSNLKLTTTWTYDLGGRVTSVTSPAGTVTRNVYDAADRLVFSIDETGAVTRTLYDNDGRVTSTVQYAALYTPTTVPVLTEMIGAPGTPGWVSTNANAASDLVTSNIYDAGGRVLTVTVDPGTPPTDLNLVTTYTYDNNGNATTVTDAAGKTTRNVYDGDNRLAFTIDPTNDVTGYTYDGEGRIVQTVRYTATYAPTTVPVLTDMIGAPGTPGWVATNTTTTATTDVVTRATYDGAGRLAYTIDATNAVTGYTYDGDGRVLQKVQYYTAFPAASTGIQSLANMINLVTTSTSDLTTRVVYDAAGREGFAIDGVGGVTGYTYDNDGRVLQTVRYPALYSTTVNPAWSVMNTWAGSHTTGALVSLATYDGAGRLTYTIDGADAVTRYIYDSNGRVLQSIQYAGTNTATTPQDLTAMNSWASSNAANARTTTSTYDAAGRLKTVVDAGGYETAYNYDTFGQMTQQVRYATSYTTLPGTPPAGSLVTRYAYDAAGRLAYTIDATNAVTGYTYDGDGRVLQKVQYYTAFPAASTGIQSLASMINLVTTSTSDLTTHTFYDDAGRKSFDIDAAGAVTAYTYDSRGRVTTMVEYAVLYGLTSSGYVANPVQSDMVYWVSLTTNQANAHTTSYTSYDNDGRLLRVTDPLGLVTRYAYDVFGRKTTTWVAYGTTDVVTTRWNYNHNGSVVLNEFLAYGSTDQELEVFTYDAMGRKKTSTDGDGYVTSYGYDGEDRVTKTIVDYSTTAGLNLTTVNTYNSFGDLQTVTDPNGNTGYSYYDGLGRQTLQVDPEGYATRTTYDLAGQILSVTRYAQRVTVNITDLNTPPTTATTAGDNTTTFTRDGAGRVLTSTDGNGSATTTIPNDYVTTYHYDAFGNRDWMINAAGATVTYGYDANGRMTSQVTPASNVTDGTNPIAPATTTTYTYDAFGNRKLMIEDSTSSQPRTTTYVYDKDNRLTQQYGDTVTVTTFSPSTTTNAVTTTTTTSTQSQTFGYDGRGNQISVTDANGAVTATYYDDRDRKSAQVDATGALTTWTYDDNNNLLTQIVYTTRIAVPTTPVSTATPPAAPTDGLYRETDYTYDKANRLVSTTLKFPSSGSPAVTGVKTGKWDTTKTPATWTESADLATIVTATMAYDANGNIIQQTDANGNKTYTWYDKLGRKSAQVDAGGYMTSYVLDAEGNVTSQTQYTTALPGPFTAGGSPPTAPTAIAATDRTTTFTYDHDGQRLSETRTGLVASVISDGVHAIGGNVLPGGALLPAGTVITTTPLSGTVTTVTSDGVHSIAATVLAAGTMITTTNSSATITFVYNTLGQVTSKTEATGDVTTYVYDTMGRVAKMTTASGSANANTTLSTYDGLGNLLKTVAGFGSATLETTSFVYGTGGRLTSKTDATGFVTTYGYDGDGHTTLQKYTRLKSDGTTVVTESSQTVYTALGQTASTYQATLTSGQWAHGDTTDSYYNAYGEVIARGVNTGGDSTKAQEYADYDAAGRVWRSNMGDGVTKVYAYDANGNMTLQIQSLGATDLGRVTTGSGFVAITSLDDALNATGTSRIIKVYDSRNELIDTKQPASVNPDGTIASASSVTTGPTTITMTQINTGGSWNGVCTDTIKVELSGPAVAKYNGSGRIHVVVASNSNTFLNGTQTYDVYLSPGALHGDAFNFSFVNPTSAPTSQNVITVTVTQEVAGSTDVPLAAWGFMATGGEGVRDDATNVHTTTLGSQLEVRGVNPLATGLTMYVRAAGSSGGYTAVTADRMYDGDGNVLPGGFTVDSSYPPFNKTASSNWDIKYVAVDAQGHAVDAKAGSMSFDASSNPTAGTFTAIPVFTASGSAGALTLATNTLPAAYSDSLQAFSAFGDVLTQTDANGNTTTYTYDVLGDVMQTTGATVNVTDAAGVVHSVHTSDSYAYDKSGRLAAHTDANGNLTTQILLAGTGYGGTNGLTTSQWNADGSTALTSYDIFDNALTQTDGIGAVTTNTYDLDNRLTTVAHALRTTTSGDRTYTSGSVYQLIDTYVYDGLGERTKHTNNVLGSAETTDYDLQGRVTQTTSFGAQATTYNYTWTAATGSTASSKFSAGKGDSGYWTKTTTEAGHTSSTNTDDFGKSVASTDFGGHVTSYTYNRAGQVTHQSIAGTNQQSIDYTYTADGQVATIIDSVTGLASFYSYDNNGNRTREVTYTTGAAPVFYENESVTYDSLNRITEVKDLAADITYAYDANGNRRNIHAAYTQAGSYTGYGQDYWYLYDSMNRFTLTKGTLSGSSIVAGTDSITLAYNSRGDRLSATFGTATSTGHHVETYTYTVDGYLDRVDVDGVKNATRTTDVLGRMTGYSEYQSNGTTVLSTRGIAYDGDNRVTTETDYTYATDTSGHAITYRSVVTNDYKAWNGTAYSGTDQGVLVHSKNVQSSSTDSGSTWSSAVTTDSNYNYVWWSSAKVSNVKINGTDPSNSAADDWKPGVATYTYDVNGNLTSVQDGGVVDKDTGTNGINRTITYRNNVFGEVMSRVETNVVSLYNVAGAQRRFFYLNGQVIGDDGNDQLADRVDYAQQMVTDRLYANNAGATFNTGSATPIVGVNGSFSNYQAYDAATVSQAGSSYTVNAGDSLQSIALTLWGDSSLWYVLADANGMDAGATLAAGVTLTVPGNVVDMHNSSGIFKPYNPSDAQGNTNPTLPSEPQPPVKQHGCGMLGDMIAMVVAVAVAVVISVVTEGMGTTLSGAILQGAMIGGASDLAYQGTEMVVGNQAHFNWAELGASIVAGGIEGGAGLNAGPPGVEGALKGVKAFGQAVLHGLERSAIQQGANMAFGLQKKFDWTGMAVAGVSAGVAYGAGTWASNNIKASVGGLTTGEAYVANRVLVGTAGLLAGAATKSLLTGQQFSKSLREALPEAIGSTIGNMIGEQIGAAYEAHHAKVEAEKAATAFGGSSSHTPMTLEDYAAGLVTDDGQQPASWGNKLRNMLGGSVEEVTDKMGANHQSKISDQGEIVVANGSSVSVGNDGTVVYRKSSSEIEVYFKGSAVKYQGPIVGKEQWNIAINDEGLYYTNSNGIVDALQQNWDSVLSSAFATAPQSVVPTEHRRDHQVADPSAPVTPPPSQTITPSQATAIAGAAEDVGIVVARSAGAAAVRSTTAAAAEEVMVAAGERLAFWGAIEVANPELGPIAAGLLAGTTLLIGIQTAIKIYNIYHPSTRDMAEPQPTTIFTPIPDARGIGLETYPNNGPLTTPPIFTPNNGPQKTEPFITPNNGPQKTEPLITPMPDDWLTGPQISLSGGVAWPVPQAAIDKIPKTWGTLKPTRDGVGVRWVDPKNQGNGVRIDEGNPNNSQIYQQVDHVVVRSGGNTLGRDGKPLPGPIADNAYEAHIPLDDWLKWKSWNSPN